MDADWLEIRVMLITIMVVVGILFTGCLGISPNEANNTSTENQNPQSDHVKTTDSSTPSSTDDTEEWNASVAISTSKTSFASRNAVFNGWNVSIEITSIDGASEVIYVYQGVNVVEGNSTRTGLVGTEVGNSTSDRSLYLLQKDENVTVYALKDNERKKIGYVEIESSYTSSWNGTRSWDDSWRGDPPESISD